MHQHLHWHILGYSWRYTELERLTAQTRLVIMHVNKYYMYYHVVCSISLTCLVWNQLVLKPCSFCCSIECLSIYPSVQNPTIIASSAFWRIIMSFSHSSQSLYWVILYNLLQLLLWLTLFICLIKSKPLIHSFFFETFLWGFFTEFVKLLPLRFAYWFNSWP